MNRYCLHSIYILLALVSVCASPVHADGPVIITNCSTDSQLRQAATAPGNSLISFNCGPGAHTIPIRGFITVQGNVQIDGAGAISLDGGGASSIFQVFVGARLELRNMTVQRGSTNSMVALENFGTLTLDGVLVTRNQALVDGGALINHGTLSIHASSFIDNSTSAGTAGGAIIGETGSITISDSLFANNKVTTPIGLGGAIAIRAGTLTVIGSSFSANNALDGGALWLQNGAAARLVAVRMLNNTAGYGGAIESSGQLDISDSLFAGNQATTGDGGALWILDSDTDIDFSTFSQNRAATTGGAISCYGNTVSVINSTINANQANDNGGAIYSTCNLNMSSTTISGNSSAKGGGALYQGGSGNASIVVTTIASNSALFGGGLYNDSAGASTLNVRASMLAANASDDCGGVVSSLGYNLASDNTCASFVETGDKRNQTLPLAALANNGGPTFTHLPLPGNPAIDALPAGPCILPEDQRNAPRPARASCDIGAVEVGAQAFRLSLPLILH